MSRRQLEQGTEQRLGPLLCRDEIRWLITPNPAPQPAPANRPAARATRFPPSTDQAKAAGRRRHENNEHCANCPEVEAGDLGQFTDVEGVSGQIRVVPGR